MSKRDEHATEKERSQTQNAEDREGRDARDRERDEPSGPPAKTSSGNTDEITDS